MQQHHGYVNFVLAVVIGTSGLWSSVLENVSFLAAKFVPIIALAVGCLQLWFLLRKLQPITFLKKLWRKQP